MLIGLADGVLASLRARYTPQHTWKILLRITWHQWCVHVRCLMYMSDWKCSVVPHIKLYNLQPKAWYLNAGPIHCRIMLHLNWYCALIAFCYVYRLIWNLFCFFLFQEWEAFQCLPRKRLLARTESIECGYEWWRLDKIHSHQLAA